MRINPFKKSVQKSKRRSGFTLIEQLVVLMIIVAAAGFGAIRVMENYHKNSVDLLAKDLKTVIQFLQMKAIEEGVVYELTLSGDARKIIVKRQPRNEKEFKAVRSSWLAGIQTGQSIKLGFERGQNILFYPDGRSSPNRLMVAKDSGERTFLELKNRIGTIEVKRA